MPPSLLVLARELYTFQLAINNKSKECLKSVKALPDPHGHHQMVNTEIRLIIFFATKDGEALYSQHKQDREQTVAQIMNPLLPNSGFN